MKPLPKPLISLQKFPVEVNGEVNIFGYKFKCLNAADCNDLSNPQNHPLLLLNQIKLHNLTEFDVIPDTQNQSTVWEYLGISEQTPEMKCRRYPDFLTHVPRNWNESKGSYFSQEEDYSVYMPGCLDYLVEKFNPEKTDYELLDMVYYFGARFICTNPDRCNELHKNRPDMSVGDGWEIVNEDLLYSLTIDNIWKENDAFFEGQVIDHLGGAYECLDESRCSTTNPILSIFVKEEDPVWDYFTVTLLRIK